MSFKISLYLQTQLWSHSIVSREKTFSALIKNAAWPSQSLNAVMVRNSYGAIRLGLEAEGQWIWHASLPAALEGVSDLRDASVCMAAGLFSRAPSRVLAAMLVLSTALSFGPGGFVARMSRTESAICLLARLTRSPPRLCLDCMLSRPKDRSLIGVELAGRDPSGCQDKAGGSLSWKDCRPMSLQSFLSSPFELAGCAVVVKGCADAAKIEGGIFAPDIPLQANAGSLSKPVHRQKLTGSISQVFMSPFSRHFLALFRSTGAQGRIETLMGRTCVTLLLRCVAKKCARQMSLHPLALCTQFITSGATPYRDEGCVELFISCALPAHQTKDRFIFSALQMGETIRSRAMAQLAGTLSTSIQSNLQPAQGPLLPLCSRTVIQSSKSGFPDGILAR